MYELTHDGRRYRLDDTGNVAVWVDAKRQSPAHWRKVKPHTFIYAYVIAKRAGVAPLPYVPERHGGASTVLEADY